MRAVSLWLALLVGLPFVLYDHAWRHGARNYHQLPGGLQLYTPPGMLVVVCLGFVLCGTDVAALVTTAAGYTVGFRLHHSLTITKP